MMVRRLLGAWVGAAALLAGCGGGPANTGGSGGSGGAGGTPVCPVVAAVPNAPARNAFLADSNYSIGHVDAAQQDASLVTGPCVRTQTLTEMQRDYQQIGPGHFGMFTSGEYRGGRRALWSNGVDVIAKLDHDTFEVIDVFELDRFPIFSSAEMEDTIAELNTATGMDGINFAIQLAARYLQGLAGVYALLDADNKFYVGSTTSLTVYTDESPGDIDSAIVVDRTWDKPDSVLGDFIGVNMTYDGWLIIPTDAGQLLAVKRDFSEFKTVMLNFSEEAAAHNAKATAGFRWVRNPPALDDAGGIYIASNDHMHKVVWTGTELSVDPNDGAWTEPYPNTRGLGTGATPSLMGFGEEDKFVVITDGNDLMNVTLFWRDEIPDGWQQLPGAPSSRIAGMVPADFGDDARTNAQSEQSVIVAGYGAMVVNNDPTNIPDLAVLQGRNSVLLSGFFGNDPEYQPFGVQKMEWDPSTQQFLEDWVRPDISSPNGVPLVSLGSGIVYNIGVRDRQWTLEALDWETGVSVFHLVVGDQRFNSTFSGIQLDENGNIIYGGPFGKIRLRP